MKKDEKLTQLEDECLALEQHAGIAQAMERAYQGSLFPLGAGDGEDPSPDEYFADESDILRRRMRRAYFSVQDVDLRRKLIALRRKWDKHFLKSFDADVAKADDELREAKQRALSQPWGKSALCAVGAVAIGYWAFHIAGAVGGAVAGFFIGQGIVAKAKREAQAEIEGAENNLADCKRYRYVNALHPESFSADEEVTGERNQQLVWCVTNNAT
jgi:hypothetical protein